MLACVGQPTLALNQASCVCQMRHNIRERGFVSLSSGTTCVIIGRCVSDNRYPPLRVYLFHESGRSPPGSSRPDKAGMKTLRGSLELVAACTAVALAVASQSSDVTHGTEAMSYSLVLTATHRIG